MGQFLKDPQAAQQEMQQMINNNVNRVVDVGLNLFNRKSSKKLMREQMQYQMLMQQQAQAWQEKMWNEANAYNDPKNQRARLESAGINPAMALGGVQGATASSMTSPTSSQGSVPALEGFVNPVDKQLARESAAAAIAMQRASASKTEAEADLVKSQLPYATKKAEAEVNNLIELGNVYRQQTEKLFQEAVSVKGQNELFERTKDWLADNVYIQNQQARQDLALKEIEVKIAQFNLSMLPDRTRLEFAELNARINNQLAQVALAYSEKRLTEQQFLTELNRTEEAYWQSQTVKSNLKYAEKLQPIALHKATEEATYARRSNKFGWRVCNVLGNVIGAALGAGAAVYGAGAIKGAKGAAGPAALGRGPAAFGSPAIATNITDSFWNIP